MYASFRRALCWEVCVGGDKWPPNDLHGTTRSCPLASGAIPIVVNYDC